MTFWKPGAAGPGWTLDRGCDSEGSILINPKLQNLPISSQRQKLPVFQHYRSILYALERHRTLVIVGETGCGKTTQIPQYLHQAGWTKGNRAIVCTQPRRVAAVSIAARVAQEMGVKLGEEVGYAVRFDEKCSQEIGRTVIKYVTDGLLLRELMLDPLLSRYSVVMLDEAHERTIHNDILFGLLRKILNRRTDLRIIISSATLDAELFCDFFETSKSPEERTSVILSIQGRQHTVDILYSEVPVSNYLRGSAEAVFAIHKEEPPGDILVFLPGTEEIDTVVRMIRDSCDSSIIALPLHASLSQNQQMAVFEVTRPGVRKVVVATNIAETSVTLDGIRFVVDSCFVRLPFFDPSTGLESLITTVTSKASATQRAGRAGRVSPGKCLRLVTEDDYNTSLPLQTPPEIQRSDMSSAVLLLKAMGIHDLVHFEFLSPPTYEALERAMELLYSLGAINENADLTEPLGRNMAEMPLEPRLAKMVISSWTFGCVEEILTIASMLSVQGPFERPRGGNAESRTRLRSAMSEFSVLEGDHLTYLNVYNAFLEEGNSDEWCKKSCLDRRTLIRAKEIRHQLERYMRRQVVNLAERYTSSLPSCDDNTIAIRKSIVSGYFSNSAMLCPDGNYRTVRERTVVTFHPSSVLSHFGTPPDYVVFHEIVMTTQLFIRDISAIDPKWLIELAPHFFELQENR